VDEGDSDAGGDYGTPMRDDYAIVKVKAVAEMPELKRGGLFDEAGSYPGRRAGSVYLN
jgi:hypothetical protein